MNPERSLGARAIAVLTIVVGTAFVPASPSAATAERQPGPEGMAKLERIADELNVLVVTIDTLRADRLGSYGYPGARTPVLDALAASGARFANAYALQPITLPSHTTLFTGTHPARHGIADNGLFRVPDTATTLAEMMRDAGVVTGAVVASFALNRQFGLDQGFETYDDSLAGGYKQGAGGFEEMTATSVSDRALAWIAQHAEERWLLWTHFYDPHAEYQPPSEYLLAAEHPYDGEVAYVDFELGRILDDLDQRGLRDRTLVIVTSDHGESLGEHGELTHGLFLYESVMRIPLIVSLPGTVPPGRVVNRMASLLDITPTVLAAVGANTLESVQGRSLVPLLFSDGAGWQDVPLIMETQMPWNSYRWSPSKAIVDQGMKLIDAPTPELYDLDRDPKELTNLLEDDPRRGDTLAAQLEQLHKTLGGDGTDSDNTVSLDDATRDRLASLGYISSATQAAPDDDAPDVKDRIDVVQRVADASLLLDSGREDEAIRLLESVVEQSPDSPRLLNRLGIWYARRKDFQNAERHFKHLLDVEPDFIEGYENLALMYANGGRRTEAIQLADAALAKSPRSAKAWGVLGIVRLYEKDYRGALEPLSRAIEYYPAYHEALSNRGVAYFYLQEFEAALDDFRLASEIVPDNESYARFVDQTERALAAR